MNFLYKKLVETKRYGMKLKKMDGGIINDYFYGY